MGKFNFRWLTITTFSIMFIQTYLSPTNMINTKTILNTGRLKSLIKNISILSIVLGIVTFWPNVPTPSEKKLSEKSRKESAFSHDENTPCITNRRKLAKYFEVNNTNHDFSCYLMNPNITEKQCKIEESNAKKFFNDNQVLRRLRSKIYVLSSFLFLY